MHLRLRSRTRTKITRLPASTSSSLKHDAALLFVVTVWGLNFPIIKVPLEVMHPFTVNLFRYSVSACVLGIAWYAHASRNGIPFAGVLRTYPLAVVGLALIGHAGYQLLFILGINNTTAGNSALIMASSPIWTALIAHVYKIDKIRNWQWIGLMLSFVGVLVVILGGQQKVSLANNTLLGNILILCGSLSWALYTTLSKPILNRGAPALGLTFFTLLASMPIIGGLGILVLPETEWSGTSVTVWAAILFSGGLSTGLAYALWNIAVRRVGPSQTAAFMNLVPIIALFAAYALISEPITLRQVSGGALIIGGLVMMRHL